MASRRRNKQPEPVQEVELEQVEGGGLGIDEGIMIATFVLLIGAIVLVYFAGESYSIPKAG